MLFLGCLLAQLIACHQGEGVWCTSIEGKICFFLWLQWAFSFCWLGIQGYTKAHLRYSVLMTYKSSTNFFCQALKSHSTPYVRWYTVWSTTVRHTKNHKWRSCFSLWIEPGASNWTNDVPGVLRHSKHWLCLGNYNSQLPIAPLEPFFWLQQRMR
jgi:hypothetical protein